MLRLVKTVRDIKLSKSKKEKVCTTMEGKQTPLYIPKLGVKQVLVATTW